MSALGGSGRAAPKEEVRVWTQSGPKATEAVAHWAPQMVTLTASAATTPHVDPRNRPTLGVLFPAMSEHDQAPDFLLEWYKLHRLHELELNKATLAYELELAKLLVLLNGAAAGAFLTLTGAIWKEGARPAFYWVAGAIISWLIGLLAAAIYTDRAYGVQREYTRASRFRRQGEELRRIRELRKNGTVIERRHLGIGADDPVDEAIRARTKADERSGMVPRFRYVAVFFFILGGVLALISFYPPLTLSASTAQSTTQIPATTQSTTQIPATTQSTTQTPSKSKRK